MTVPPIMVQACGAAASSGQAQLSVNALLQSVGLAAGLTIMETLSASPL
jgi:hypothetical protein